MLACADTGAARVKLRSPYHETVTMSTPANSAPTSENVAAVDPKLAAIISRVESANNPMAQRFERKIFNRITDQGSTNTLSAIQKANVVSSDTGRVIYSTSWGLYQIMGFNLYGMGYAGKIHDYLLDADTQMLYYAKFVTLNNINFTWNQMLADNGKMVSFAIHYNGNSAYETRMRQAAKELGY